MMHWHGWGMGYSWPFWVVVLVAVVTLVMYLTRQATPPPNKSAEDILKERFARGEISKEEYNAIAALKAIVALKARVKRDGRWIEMPSRELVPDDLVHLRLGDIVPADARLKSQNKERCAT